MTWGLQAPTREIDVNSAPGLRRVRYVVTSDLFEYVDDLGTS